MYTYCSYEFTVTLQYTHANSYEKYYSQLIMRTHTSLYTSREWGWLCLYLQHPPPPPPPPPELPPVAPDFRDDSSTPLGSLFWGWTGDCRNGIETH